MTGVMTANVCPGAFQEMQGLLASEGIRDAAAIREDIIAVLKREVDAHGGDWDEDRARQGAETKVKVVR